MRELRSKIYKHYYKLKPMIRFFLSQIMFTKVKTNQLENNFSHRILVFTYTNYWKSYPTHMNVFQDKTLNRDTFLGDIITNLKNQNFDVIALDTDTSFFIDFKTMIGKYIQDNR